MRKIGVASVFSALLAANAAHAQSANSAFECTLPYRAAMGSMANLDVLSETRDEGIKDLLGPATKVEFDPASTLVYGLSPSKLSIEMREPLPGVREKFYSVEFKATFQRTNQTDGVLLGSNKWKYDTGSIIQQCMSDSPKCYRSGEQKFAGNLEFLRHSDSVLTLICQYRLRDEDLEE